MNWELIISGIALIISGLSWYYSKKANRRSNDLQEKMLNIELKRERDKEIASKKAELIPNFVAQKQFRVVNNGKGEARNVRITINDYVPSEHPDILEKSKDVDRISRIREGTGFVYNIAIDKDSEQIWNISIKWDDDANKDNQEFFERRV